MTGSLAESLIARIVRQRDLMHSMNEHCGNISVRVTSRDQTVSVEVDGVGAMTDLKLNEHAYRHGPEGLATLIVDTAQAAAKVALERRQQLSEQFNAELAKLQHEPLTRWDGTVVRPEPASRGFL